MAALDRAPAAKRLAVVAEALRAGFGARPLADPKIAAMVERALLHFDGARYRLLGWCIMPTHVHVLVELLAGHTLSSVLQAWKSFTAKEANAMLGRSGAFWAPEYYDRFMRNEAHLETSRAYVERNPVIAGLCETPEEWRFSSAWGRTYE
jgi:REP element-mobilizing transposase RayT